MAEYVLKEGEDHADVARRLLDATDDPNSVAWAPRPDTYGGGVYVVNDEAAVAKVAGDLHRQREEQAQRIADAQRAADERDAKASETGLTPAQLGLPANTGTDPGAPGTEGTPAEDVSAEDDSDEDDSDEGPVADDPATPEDESKMTPAQRRKAARQAKADQGQSDDASEGAK